MKTYQDYKAVQEKINATAKTVRVDILLNDACVDINNAGSDDNYDLLIAAAVNRFGMTCEELGLNARDFGFDY